MFEYNKNRNSFRKHLELGRTMFLADLLENVRSMCCRDLKCLCALSNLGAFEVFFCLRRGKKFQWTFFILKLKDIIDCSKLLVHDYLKASTAITSDESKLHYRYGMQLKHTFTSIRTRDWRWNLQITANIWNVPNLNLWSKTKKKRFFSLDTINDKNAHSK